MDRKLFERFFTIGGRTDMRRKQAVMILALSVLVTTAAVPASLYAEETPAEETAVEETVEDTAEEAAETADAAGENAVEDKAETAEEAENEPAEETADPTKITVSVDGTDIVIENDTETVFTKAEIIVETADMDVEAGDEVTELPPIYTLALETEEGALHFFSNIDPLAWMDPVLVEEYGIYYVQFHDAEGEGEEPEDAEEKDLPEPVTVHTTADANIRKAPSLDGEKIRTTSPGEEFTAVGAAPGWVHVKSEKEEGYIAHQYLTYEKAVAEEQPTQDPDEEQPSQPQEQPSQPQQPSQPENEPPAAPTEEPQAPVEEPAVEEPEQSPVQPEVVPDTPTPAAPSTSETKKEVSRTAYDDNDGSGHGYWEILYSDGSVAYVKY